MDPTQLLKGVLDAAVLAVVQHEDGYGYDVVRRLRDAGLEEVGDASVYGTLRRLYAAGALSTYVVPSEGGPHRKYYSMTPAGRALLDEQRAGWLRFSAVLTDLVAGGGVPVAATAAGEAPAAANTPATAQAEPRPSADHQPAATPSPAPRATPKPQLSTTGADA